MRNYALLFVCAMLLCGIACTNRQPATTAVATDNPTANTATPVAPEPLTRKFEEGVRNAAFVNVVEVLNEKGQWVGLGELMMPKLDDRVGSGLSYLAKFTTGGKLEEVYPNYCVKYDPAAHKCVDERTVVARTRWIKPDQVVRIIYGAAVELEGRHIIEAVGWQAENPTRLGDIQDPVWKPAHIEREFASLDELRTQAQTNGTWMVIGSELGAPLLGQHYDKPKVHTVETDGRKFYAFEFPMKGAEKNVQGCLAMPVHIGYRFLSPGVGHDIEYGPGCVSAFGFAAGTDPRNLHNVRAVIISRNEAYYYGTPEPGFRLGVIQ